jgi:hypothetical protein
MATFLLGWSHPGSGWYSDSIRMLPMLGLFVLAASRIPVPAGEWHFVPIDLKQRPATVTASFDAPSGADRICLALVSRNDLEQLWRGLPQGALEIVGPARSGRLRHAVRFPGEYAIVLDNQLGKGKTPMVWLRVWLDFGVPSGPDVTMLSPGRRLAVIAISFAVFFAIAFFAGRKLLAAFEARKGWHA